MPSPADIPVKSPDGAPALTVLELNNRITDAVAAAPGLRNVWVIGETSDLRVNNHCYFELLQKDDAGNSVARIRANCWAQNWRAIDAKFLAYTGQHLAGGIKLMVRATVNYHPSYGMSINVTDVDPAYTLGDAVRRQREILDRLTREGLIDRQKALHLPLPATRVAVVSAAGAAGYGDFVNQLLTTPEHIRFSISLFPAIMQGERAVPSILEVLRTIAARSEEFDAVVIIRGGGSTSDLACFDSYELGRAIALMPLPVISGIGHERDNTVPDFVAHTRAKTPTAAAEMLIGRARRMFEALNNAANILYTTVVDRMAGDREMLARFSATIPGSVQAVLLAADNTLRQATLHVAAGARMAIEPARQRIDTLADTISPAVGGQLLARNKELDALDALTRALSPQSALRRGFSITYAADGRALRTVADAPAGTALTTVLADGSIHSTVNN